jgi:hypothetical protein
LPSLLTFDSKVTVKKVRQEGTSCLRFRRVLRDDTAEMMKEMTEVCEKINLTAERDRTHWKLGKKGITVKLLTNQNFQREVSF